MAQTIEQYTQALQNLERMAERAKTQIMDLQSRLNRGDSSAINDLSRRLADVKELTQAYRQLEMEKSKAMSSTPGNYIAGGAASSASASAPRQGPSLNFDGLPGQYVPSVQKAMQNLKAVGSTIKSVEIATDGVAKVAGTLSVENNGLALQRDFKLFVDAVGNYSKTFKGLQRQQIISNPANAKLFEQAGIYGFQPTDLRRMQASNSGAYQVAQFRRNVGGVDQQQEFNVDRQGGISTAPTQRRFQSFSQTVGKDIGDLLKWSIAISAIYGPLNAMSAAMQELIENEVRLADVSVALNDEVASTDDVFEDVYESSKLAGESVGGVIDAFGQAYRAAGRVGDEFQRYETSIGLLNDSLVLSKLSTLDQAGAIDVLTAALYQSAPAGETAAESLSRGSDLLDKWVRVSKIASVDIATLATGVAVLGDTAETAGLSLEQLNAFVATISETSLSGGKEAANIAKALIGGYQSDVAVKELNRLGIAVTDTTGKTRQFMDVMQDVASLRSQGILGDEDFNRLTLALGGGGTRRQKDVAAFIENFDRMNQIVGLQDGSQGESQNALAKKLDTVQTSATNLGNSFTNLAQTMGNEGGLLDAFSSTLNTATILVDTFDKLAGAVGKVGPMLMAFGVGSLLLGGTSLTDKLANNVTVPLAQRFGGSMGMGVSAAQYLTGRPLGGLTGAAGRLGNIPSLAAIGLPAAQNFSSGDSEEGIANLIGGGLGALAGGPVGALIGSAIAEAFVRTTLTYDVQFADFFAGTLAKGMESGSSDPASQQSIDDLMSEAFGSVLGSELIGKAVAKTGYTLSKFGLAGNEGGEEFASEEAAMLNWLERFDPQTAEKLKSRFAAQSETGALPTETSLLEQRQLRLSGQDSPYLRKLQGGREDELRTQLIEGDIKPSEYASRMSNLSAFTVTATRNMAALTDEAGNLAGEFTSSSQAYEAFLNIASSGNQELISQLNAQITAIEYYENLLENWKPGEAIQNKLTGTTFTPEGVGDIQSLLSQSMEAYASTVKFGDQQIRLQNLQIPDVYGSNLNPTAAGDVEAVKRRAIEVQERRYADLDPETYQALVDSFETFAQLVEDSGDVFYDKITGIDKNIYSEVFQDMQQKGEIAGEQGGLDFTSMDITRPQLEQAVARANQLSGQLQKEFPGYEPNMEDVLIATSDEQISKQHTDMKLLQYVLQQILDTEKKQLEGIYNMPEGSTFWVPLTAAWLADRPYGDGGGMGDGFGLKNPEVVSSPTSVQSTQYSDYDNSRYGLSKAMEEMLDSDYNKQKESTGYRRDDPMGDIQAGAGASDASGPIDMLVAKLSEILRNLGLPTAEGLGGGLAEGIKGGKTISPRDIGETQQQTTQSTKLDIKFSATTQLMVDGRVLASIVKPYLASDLLKTNESGGTVTRTYVI